MKILCTNLVWYVVNFLLQLQLRIRLGHVFDYFNHVSKRTRKTLIYYYAMHVRVCIS